MIVETEGLQVPFFEIATNPKWHMREGLDKEALIIARAKDSISRQEDNEILNCISNAVPGRRKNDEDDRYSHIITVTGEFEPDQITKLCLHLWQHEVRVANIGRAHV